jgi:dTDP-4-dehydrorhamnose reductase
MRILVIGASGLLGSNFSMISSKNHDVTATYTNHPVSISDCRNIFLDATKIDEINNAFKLIKPEIVVNCSGLTNVDYCETHEKEAILLNVIIPENLVRSQNNFKFKLVHISTDAVFDGIKGNYDEDDETNPLNVYSKTKVLGENKVSSSKDYLLLRTNIFGWNIQDKLCLAEWFIDKLKKKEKINAFTDVFFNPVTVNSLSNIILELTRKNINGLFHVGSTKVSKYEYGTKIAELFEFSTNLLVPSSIDNSTLVAKRPKNTTLNTGKIEKLIKMPNIDEELRIFHETRYNGYYGLLKAGK